MKRARSESRDEPPRGVLKIGRNDPCWCGSGKKLKKCHLAGETGAGPDRQEVLRRFMRVYETGRCLHPDAHVGSCSGDVIAAHTIQRSGGLDRIARRGHVYNMAKHGRFYDRSKWAPDTGPISVGTKEASTFRGFCSRHDSQLFEPIERQPFSSKPEQIALLGYRAISYEWLMKEKLLETNDINRDILKDYPPLERQQYLEHIMFHNVGVRKGIEDIKDLADHYSEMIMGGDYTGLAYYIVMFGDTPDVVSSGVIQTTHDFNGNKVAELGHPGHPVETVAYSLIVTDEGGAAVFSWPREHSLTSQVMATLDELPDQELPHAITRFTFEWFENTYFGPDWWDSLDEETQVALKIRQLRDVVGPVGDRQYPRPDDCLSDDGIRAVAWNVTGRERSF